MKKIPNTDYLYMLPDGSVYSERTNSKRKLTVANTGYLVFSHIFRGRSCTLSHHRAVWETLVGPIPKGKYINHKNGIKTDNRISNLEVVTPAENNSHAREVLKVNLKRKRRLNHKNINRIKNLLKSGMSLRGIEENMGLARNSLSQVTRRNSTKYLEYRGTFEIPKRPKIVHTRKRGRSYIAWYNCEGRQVVIGSRISAAEIEKTVGDFINSARSKYTRKEK